MDGAVAGRKPGRTAGGALTPARAAIEQGEVRRVLVIRAARVGDTLHVRPALELLRSALPEAQLTFLCSDYAAAAARGAAVDDVVPYPHKGRGPRAILARRQVEARLRKSGAFDLGLGLEDKPWGRRLAHRLQCRWWHAESTAGTHVVERKAGVLVPLGLWDGEAPPPHVSWSATNAALAHADGFLAGLPEPRVGLQVGSHATRGWRAPRRRREPAEERLVALGAAVAESTGGSLVVHGGQGGEERRAARAVASALRQRLGTERVALLDKLVLDELGAVLARLDCFVSANTGPAHLAAATGTPVVVLEGPSTSATRPWCPPERVRVINLGLECSPCRGSAHGKSCLVPRCLDDVPEARVADAVAELLV
ncbi:glycosyltransferase family 9 protein [Planctomycetota bacterium]|nr:glycosyltransferase family 9 protein [Planctomycetota bacterium]